MCGELIMLSYCTAVVLDDLSQRDVFCANVNSPENTSVLVIPLRGASCIVVNHDADMDIIDVSVVNSKGVETLFKSFFGGELAPKTVLDIADSWAEGKYMTEDEFASCDDCVRVVAFVESDFIDFIV